MSDWFQSYGFAEVFPEMLVGAYPLDEADVAVLASLGVRRVLNLADEGEYREGQRVVVQEALAARGIEEIRLSIVDFGHLPADRLDQAVRIVLDWMDGCERTYIHCRAGWQRSAAVAAGAIAVFGEVEVTTALQSVRQRKPTADPLPHQRVDLLDWWLTRGRQLAGTRARAARAPDAWTPVDAPPPDPGLPTTPAAETPGAPTAPAANTRETPIAADDASVTDRARPA